MTSLILFLLLVLFGGWVWYGATNAPERKRLLEQACRTLRRLSDAAPLRDPRIASFWTLLRQRTPLALVTPGLAALNVIVFVLMLWSAGPINSPDTVIAWGGSFGPRTTNGEWWRLMTTTFVHVKVLHLFVEVIGLLTVGVVLERLVGPLAFAVVYAAAGVASSALGLQASPTGMTFGASGAIFGLYGLMLTVVCRSVLHRSMARFPWAIARYLVPVAAVFGLYSLLTNWVASGPELAALVVGCLSGLVVGRGVEEQRAAPIFSVPLVAGAIAMVVVTVQPMSGMTDVRPDILRLVTAEHQMAALYQRATGRFIDGRINAGELAGVIDRDILPELHTLHERFASLEHVPDEQRPLITAAQKYLQLRDESWRMRLNGLNTGSESMLKQGEWLEMAANAALNKIE